MDIDLAYNHFTGTPLFDWDTLVFDSRSYPYLTEDDLAYNHFTGSSVNTPSYPPTPFTHPRTHTLIHTLSSTLSHPLTHPRSYPTHPRTHPLTCYYTPSYTPILPLTPPPPLSPDLAFVGTVPSGAFPPSILRLDLSYNRLDNIDSLGSCLSLQTLMVQNNSLRFLGRFALFTND